MGLAGLPPFRFSQSRSCALPSQSGQHTDKLERTLSTLRVTNLQGVGGGPLAMSPFLIESNRLVSLRGNRAPDEHGHPINLSVFKGPDSPEQGSEV